MGHVLENKIHEFSFTTHFMGHCKSNLSLTSRIREIFSLHLGSCFFLIKAVWGGHWVDGGTLGDRFPLGRLVRLSSNTRTDIRDKRDKRLEGQPAESIDIRMTRMKMILNTMTQ